MRIYLILFLIYLNVGCKPKETPIVNTVPKEDSLKDDRVIGTVSHRFHVKNCGTVIVIKEGNEEVILQPVIELEKAIDVDGVKIRFHYEPSRAAQKEGCLDGKPAIISDIEAM